MILLGISTSAKRPSAAVMKRHLGREAVVSYCVESRPGVSHSESLMALIEEALDAAQVDKTELEAIAVDVGPGSFTGVRIGVSCANAMALALGIPVIPVCSLAALRADIPEEGIVASFIDCRNGNCYAAVYEGAGESIPPCAAVTDEVKAALPEDAVIVGDCFGKSQYPDARLVLLEAAKGRIAPCEQAVPTYLRPSQAERMRTGGA